MKNSYEIRGDVTAIFLCRKDGSVLETLIDTSDLQRANEFPMTWCARLDRHTNSYYVYGALPIGNGKRRSVHLHRWLFGEVSEDIVIDHNNHDTLDNRRSVNLKEATNGENTQNRKGPNVNCKSGFRGVYWNPKLNKWIAKICVNYRNIHLGCFEELDAAASAVAEARKNIDSVA